MKKHSTVPSPWVQLAFVFPPPLIRYTRVGFSQAFRRRFLAMHDYRCAYCGWHADTIDHFIPVLHGGTNDIANLEPACLTCNRTAWAHVFESFAEKQRHIIARRIASGSLPDGPPAVGHDYTTCIDCGRLYRYAPDATIFLCPVCRFMDENRPLPRWRRERIDSFLAREFRGREITETDVADP